MFFLDVLDWDENSAEVSDVGEDLLFGRAEAGHRLHVARLGHALVAFSSFVHVFVRLFVVRRTRADRLACLYASACLCQPQYNPAVQYSTMQYNLAVQYEG